ncbi:MAG: rhomboid family intramembrane serine protease, partial [Planctomycetota bacterium]
ALPYALGTGTARGWITYLLLHGGIFHLVGNMVFLWVFGNAICARLGNAWYPLVYVGLGLAAALAQVVGSTGPAVGASGAINGIVAMFLVLYPKNTVSCFFLVLFRPVFFHVKSYWLILLWLAFDLWGAFGGGGAIAYHAHVGGFAAGFALAVALLKTGVLEEDEGVDSLLSLLLPKEGAPPGGEELAIPKVMPPAPTPGAGPGAPRGSVGPVAGRPAEEDAPPAGAVPIDAPIRFRCACGRGFEVAAELAGRRAKCPACSAVIVVPES